jgi:hypothetical protein
MEQKKLQTLRTLKWPCIYLHAPCRAKGYNTKLTSKHVYNRIAQTCLVSGIILLSVAKWPLILSRRRRSASLWIFRASASVAPLPDPDDDDITGGPTGTAGGVELACRGSRTGSLYNEGSQPSYGCSSFPSCRGWHAAIQPSILADLPTSSCHSQIKGNMLIEIEPDNNARNVAEGNETRKEEEVTRSKQPSREGESYICCCLQ